MAMLACEWGEVMKMLVAVLVVCGTMLFAAGPALSCYEWAVYGTFRLGGWGSNNDVVGGDVIGSDQRVTSEDQWQFDYSHYVDTCRHFSWFNASVASGKWPNQGNEIRSYFTRQKDLCITYFSNVRRKFSGQFCN